MDNILVIMDHSYIDVSTKDVRIWLSSLPILKNNVNLTVQKMESDNFSKKLYS